MAWAIGPCLPAWVVLMGLALTGRLSWTAAVVACALVFVLMADFDRIIRYAEDLLVNPETAPT